MSAAWAAVVAAIGAGVLTLVGAFGAELLRNHFRKGHEKEETLRCACESLILAAQVLGFRFWIIRTKQMSLQSRRGKLALMVGVEKPLDLMETGELVVSDLERMLAAFVTIRSLGDRPVIEQATRVVTASRRVIELSTQPVTAEEKRSGEMTSELTEAIQGLGMEERKLSWAIRDHLGMEEVGLKALGLTQEASVSTAAGVDVDRANGSADPEDGRRAPRVPSDDSAG